MCLETNSLFWWLLKHLGFNVKLIRAQVLVGDNGNFFNALIIFYIFQKFNYFLLNEVIINIVNSLISKKFLLLI
jgi:hypothetical protein